MCVQVKRGQGSCPGPGQVLGQGQSIAKVCFLVYRSLDVLSGPIKMVGPSRVCASPRRLRLCSGPGSIHAQMPKILKPFLQNAPEMEPFRM